MQGQLLRQLQAFVSTAQPSYLPAFTQRAQDFQEGVQALVYDVLMLKVLLTCLSKPSPVDLILSDCDKGTAKILCFAMPNRTPMFSQGHV